ncbi:hypothetical protein [Chryseobacterium sp. JUb7]|uniref:hypothetical protein n=1 Tax=Chryseobacterium sp. JUb7 TaxID=2940599 RepID=UPI00216926DF|nr:hypothetical protein [Chryseobacterium sp. JUb7]MCS3531984.1 hypothetical protein [Chryseobacterium sp. JUb7]
MSNILAGLFEHHSDYKQLETDLENSGFKSSDYIVYLNDSNHNSQYLASVAVKDHEQAENVRRIFNQNIALKTFLFENMSLEQTHYQKLKDLIHARNRADIHNSPGVKIKSSNSGIDSAEVKF